MLGAAGVESGPAHRAGVVAGQVIGDAERAVAVTAENGFGLPLAQAPNNGRMTRRFIVALDAGIKSVAALEFDGDEVALGVVVSTLGTLVHANAVAGDGFGDFQSAWNYR